MIAFKKKSKRNYKFHFTIIDLDKVNKNGRVYSKEAIESAFADPVFKAVNDDKMLPILYHDDVTDTVVGYCSLVNKYPDIEGEGLIINHDKIKTLVENGYPCLQGICDMVNENGYIEGYEISAISICDSTAHNCSFSIE